MYQIAVPMLHKNLKRSKREDILLQLKKLDAVRVVLALDAYILNENDRKQEFAELKDNCTFFKENGYEVCAWTWTFMINDDNSYTHITSFDGSKSEKQVCPLDKDFLKFAGKYMREIAECGVDMILFDDDYRFSYIDTIYGCTCPLHLKKMSEKLGENIVRQNLEMKLFTGGANKYRDVWLSSLGESLIEFADEIRRNVDMVNPDIRIGLCSCMSVWDTDGTDSVTIAKHLAGETKPFIRLIGAPYWAVNKGWGNRLQDVIELERMESSWINDDIEIVCEGDVYPRPRFSTPANYLEGFDTALRADGSIDGILKYAIDYYSSVVYETGYTERHVKNKPLYQEIDKCFSDKIHCGVRIYESMNKLKNADLPKDFIGISKIPDLFFSPAAKMLAACSIPTVYEGIGTAGIAFGENAKYLPESALENGLIIDAQAARILEQNGVDTGIKSWHEKVKIKEEYFVKENEYINFFYSPEAYSVELNEKAEIQSYFISDNGRLPASYIYENAAGQRFLVFTFDAYFAHEDFYRQYTRSKQIADNIQWLSGKKLPAYISGNPDTYVMCKASRTALAVGIWNFFADNIPEPVVELEKEYKNITFINCTGRMEEGKVYLSEIQPFAFAGFEVRE